MRKSQADTAETRERIVSTASGMFLREGLAAVGMRDIMATAGLTQGGFYRHFHSMQQLIAEANMAATDRLFAMLESRIDGKSPRAALETIVSLYLSQSRDKNNTYLCPLAALGVELSHGGPPARAIAASAHRRFVQLIAGCLTHSSKAAREKVASGIVSTLVGAVTLANMAQDPAAAGSILANARKLVRAASGK